MVLTTTLVKTHYVGLRKFLSSYLKSQNQQNPKNSSSQREQARTKLINLNFIQFSELTTDVFDEMERRILNSESSFLIIFINLLLLLLILFIINY